MGAGKGRFAIGVIGCLCAGAPVVARSVEGPRIYALSSLATVRPRDTPVGGAGRAIELEAARGEWESAQILVRAGARPVRFSVAAGELSGPGGARLPAPELARVGFIEVTTPSNIEGSTGAWPDPLIPAVDRFDKQQRNAFPSTIAPGGDGTAWLDFFVPAGARPGRYHGVATVSDGETVIAKVPIALLVHAFSLPASSSLPATFGFSALTAGEGHFHRRPTIEEARELARRYALAALRHRISLHGGTMEAAPSDERERIDFSAYDAEVGPFLDGSADPGGARFSAVDLRIPERLQGEPRGRYLAATAAHLASRGWIGRVFEFLADEPRETDLPSVRARGAWFQRSAPGIARLVTRKLDPRLDGAVDIWCPVVNQLDDKPAGEGGPPRAAYDPRIERGERLWWYQSCMSHGCDIVGGSYFTGWPSYAIDAPAVGHRILEWLTFRYRVGGELYYDTVDAYRGPDPWRDVHRHGGNGDGTLFYPGRPDAIGGTTHIPVESIRLQRIRDGLEDYEYLSLYARLAGRAAAERFAARVATRTFEWDHDPARLSETRAALARALDRVVLSSP